MMKVHITSSDTKQAVMVLTNAHYDYAVTYIDRSVSIQEDQ